MDRRVKVTLDSQVAAVIERLSSEPEKYDVVIEKRDIALGSNASAVLSLARIGAAVVEEDLLASGYEALAAERNDEAGFRGELRRRRDKRAHGWTN